MQFMDFPGRFVLSHQLPGALQKKVLAKDGLVLGLKGGLLPGLNWVSPSGWGGALHALPAPQAPSRCRTPPEPQPPPPPAHCSPLHPALSYLTPGNSQRGGRAWPRLPLPKGGWPSFTKRLSLAWLSWEWRASWEKLSLVRKEGSGRQGLPITQLSSHFPQTGCGPVRRRPPACK